MVSAVGGLSAGTGTGGSPSGGWISTGVPMGTAPPLARNTELAWIGRLATTKATIDVATRKVLPRVINLVSHPLSTTHYNGSCPVQQRRLEKNEFSKCQL